MKKAKERTAIEVSRFKTPGRHFIGGVAGLLLQVSPSGARSWLLRIKIGTKRRDVGLGGYPDVTLADARTKARAAREKVSAGVDPIEEAKKLRSALISAQIAGLTFEQCAEAYIKAMERTWENIKHVQQWNNTLHTYAYPILGKMLVRDIETSHVLHVLEPIWSGKTETATRLRGRIERIVDWAKARGYRDGVNPARWKGHLDTLLPNPRQTARVVHHPALAVAEVGAFLSDLREQSGIGARALEFTILTAARSGETRGAMWSEIDLTQRLWTVPANRMKRRVIHRVPLSDAAIRLLNELPRKEGVELVFLSPRGAKLSDMTLSAVLRRMGVAAVPHGFRSTFRDWCAENTNFPREVAEAALAHGNRDETEAAYLRSDLYDKRQKLMQAWAAFCAKSDNEANVISIRSRRGVTSE